jgi:hypothetical protein
MRLECGIDAWLKRLSRDPRFAVSTSHLQLESSRWDFHISRGIIFIVVRVPAKGVQR